MNETKSISFEEICFVESPTTLASEAVRELRISQAKQILQNGSVGDSYRAECLLANCVVGQELP